MTTWQKVLAFVGGLALVAAAGFGIGRAVGPDDPANHDDMVGHGDHDGHAMPSNKDDQDMHGTGTGHGAGHGDEHGGKPTAAKTDGRQSSADGYTLKVVDVTARPDGRSTLGFVIEGDEGPLTTYETVHTKQMHLIVVRRDLRGFQHVHPRLLHDGVWTATVQFAPGQWRMYADFQPGGGEPLVLGAALPAQTRGRLLDRPAATGATAEAGPFEVRMSGMAMAGMHSMLAFTISRDGAPVSVEPYLGARGHLVMINKADLRYVHVHPMGDGARKVQFGAEVAEPGGYHLFYDFKVDGVVHTAHFVRDVT